MKWTIIGFCMLVAMAGCASRKGYQILLEQDAAVGSSPGAMTKMKRGEQLPLADTPLYVASPGFESLLVLPMVGDGGVIKVSLAPSLVSAAQCKDQNPLVAGSSDDVNLRTAKAVSMLLDAQISISEGNKAQGKLILDEALAKFPEVSYSYFLRASLQVIDGDKDGAVVSLERGLKDHPKDTRATALYKELTGRVFAKSDIPAVESKQPQR